EVTDALVKDALARVRRDAAARYFGEPGDALYWRSGLLARGLNDDQLLRRAGLKGLDRLTARDVAPWLKRWYQPGNASLALVGDLGGLDARALVGSVFGPLAGGPALPDSIHVRFTSARRTAPWKDLSAPVGVVAVASPALTDSLHPAFYLGMLITGPGVINSWGQPTPPLVSRFQYSIFDEPEVVRFYPPVRADATDPDVLAGALYEQL